MDPKLCVIVNRADSDMGARGPELCKFTSQRWRRDSTIGLPAAPQDHAADEEAVSIEGNDTHKNGNDGDHAANHDAQGGEGGDHHHQHHEVPRHKMPFYRPPRARYQWGVPRPNRHVGSTQLFFDLLYVGVSYRSGSLLGEDLSWKNVLIFLGTILLMYGAWFSRLSFDAMLRFDDNVHHFVFVVQALLLGLAAHQLTDVSELEDYAGGQAVGFTVCMLLNHLLQLGIWIELWATATDQPNAKAYGLIAALMECIPIGMLFVSLAMALTEQTMLVVAGIWLLTYVVSRISWQVFIIAGGLSKANSIPWDVGFCILRFGQFTMLMLGEGVLQIIIFAGNEHGAEIPAITSQGVALFFLCYALMGILQLLHFTTLPFNENDHILLRGPVAVASLWLELFALYSCALVACGVALKKVLYLHSKLFPDMAAVADYAEAKYEAKKYSSKRDKYYWFLGAALASATFLLAVQQILQVDVFAELGIRFAAQDASTAPGKPPTGKSAEATAEPEKPPAKSETEERPAASMRKRPGAPGARSSSRRSRMYFAQGHEQKRVWFARLVVVPCTFLPLGAAELDPVYVVLIADVLLLCLLTFDIFRGKFKRKRKLNRTVAAIIAIAKLKRFVRLRREQRERLQQECMERVRLLADANSEDASEMREECAADHLVILADEDAPLQATTGGSTAALHPPMHRRARSDSSASSRSKRRSFSDHMRRTLSTASGKYKLAAFEPRRARKNYVPNVSVSPRKALMRHLRIFVRETAFYRPYLPRIDWQHLHAAHEMEWQNLFYDLVVVALAYRLNQIDFADLLDFKFSMLVLYVFEASAVLDCWNQRNVLQSRFLSDDVFHRGMGLFQFGLVAFLASEVLVSGQIEVGTDRFNNYLYTFATTKLLYELTNVGQAIELWFTFRDTNAPAAGSARRYVFHFGVNVVLLVCSFVCIAFDANVLLTVFLWGAGHYVTLILVFLESSLGLVTKENSLPVDVGFLAHRESELGLIMIGEGLLSIINAHVIQSVEHYVNFVLGYAVIAATKVNYFFIQRFNPPDMAGRKSRLRGVMVAWFLPIFMVALSAVGGIAVWTYVENSDFSTSNSYEYIFRALPLSVVVVLLCFFDFMHEGPEELIYIRLAPASLALVYLAKVVCAGAFWLFIWADLTSSATLGLFFADLVLLFAAHAAHIEIRARYAATVHTTASTQAHVDAEAEAASRMEDAKEEGFGPSAPDGDAHVVNLAEEEGSQPDEDFDNDPEHEDTYEDVIREDRGREIALG